MKGKDEMIFCHLKAYFIKLVESVCIPICGYFVK